MDKIKAILAAAILPVIGFAAWSIQASGTVSNLKDVDFVDALRGWAVGGEWYVANDAVILRTTNGGSSWINVTPSGIPGGVDGLDGVSFADSLYGWAVGVDTLRCSLILGTTDGGTSWFRQAAPIDTPSPVSVCFVNRSNGWTSPGGPHGYEYQQVIFHTSNSGSAWEVQGWTNYDGGSCRLYFPDLQHGFVAGGTEMTPTTRGYIMRTTNGGASWWESYHWGAVIGFTYPLMTGVHFPVNATDGWGCGKLFGGVGIDYEIRVVRTTDGGANWNEIQVISDTSVGTPWDIHMADLQNGWIVGQGGDILRTTNGFLSWHRDTSGVAATLYGVDFADLNHGWAVGTQGTILKYLGTAPVAEPSAPVRVLPAPELGGLFAKNGRLEFFYASPSAGPVCFTVYDPAGRMIRSLEMEARRGNSKYRLDLPGGQSAGVYLLSARNDAGTVSGKFVLIK